MRVLDPLRFVFIQWLKEHEVTIKNSRGLSQAFSFSHPSVSSSFLASFLLSYTQSVFYFVFHNLYRQTVNSVHFHSYFLFDTPASHSNIKVVTFLPVIIHDWSCHIRITCLTASRSCSDYLFQCKGMQDLKSTIWAYVTKLTNL